MAKLFQVTELKIDSTIHLESKEKLFSANYVQEVVASGTGSIITLGDNNNPSRFTERVVAENPASVLVAMDGAQGSVKALSLLVLNDGGGDTDSVIKLFPVNYILEVEVDPSNASNSIVTLKERSFGNGKRYTVQETLSNILASSNAVSGGVSKAFIGLIGSVAVAWDYSLGYNAQITMSFDRTLLEPTNVNDGDYGTLVITQDGVGGHTLTLPASFKVVNGGGGAITLSSAPNSVDSISWVKKGSDFLVTLGLNFT
jgi:hypothetical protein